MPSSSSASSSTSQHHNPGNSFGVLPKLPLQLAESSTSSSCVERNSQHSGSTMAAGVAPPPPAQNSSMTMEQRVAAETAAHSGSVNNQSISSSQQAGTSSVGSSNFNTNPLLNSSQQQQQSSANNNSVTTSGSSTLSSSTSFQSVRNETQQQVPHQLAEGSNSSSSPGVLLRVASQSQRSHSPSSATATNNANAALYSQPIQLPLDVNANNGNNPAPGAPGGGSTRTIVVKKDEKGFGLRVSGDNPVFVESVKPDGAAYRHGVRAGDRIIKVNGTLVTKHGHQEVVRLIQAGGSGGYVALTLLGRPPQLPFDATLAAPVQQPPRRASSGVESSYVQQQQQSQSNNSISSPTLISGPILLTTQTSRTEITAPLPACSSTLLEFEKSKEKTIKKMIKSENLHLKNLSSSSEEHRATTQRLTALKQQLHHLKRTRARQHQLLQQQLTSSEAAAKNSKKAAASKKKSDKQSGKSRSFNDHRRLHDNQKVPIIMSMESDSDEYSEEEEGSDAELDDGDEHADGQRAVSDESDCDDEGLFGGAPSSTCSSKPEQPITGGLPQILGSTRTFLSLLYCCFDQSLDISPLLFLALANKFRSHGHQEQSSSSGASSTALLKEHLFELQSVFLLSDSPLRLLGDWKEAHLDRVYDAINAMHSDSIAMSARNSSDPLLGEFITKAQQQLQLLIVNYNKQLQLGLIRPLPSWPSPSSQSSTSQSADPSGSGGASPAPGHHEAEAEDNAQNAELRRSRRYELLAQLLNACFGGESVFPGQLPQNAASVPIPLSVILATALKQLTRGELFVKREQDVLALSQCLARALALLSVCGHYFPALLPTRHLAPLAPYLLLSSSSGRTPPQSPRLTAAQQLASSASSSTVGHVKRHKSLPSSTSVVCSTALTSPTSSASGVASQKGGDGFLAALLSPITSPSSPSFTSYTNHLEDIQHSSVLEQDELRVSGHVFVRPSLFPALSAIVFCNACGHVVWGKTLFALQCQQCPSLCHSWCFFRSEESPARTECFFRLPPQAASNINLAISSGKTREPPVANTKRHNRVTSLLVDSFFSKGSSASGASSKSNLEHRDQDHQQQFVQIPVMSSEDDSEDAEHSEGDEELDEDDADEELLIFEDASDQMPPASAADRDEDSFEEPLTTDKDDSSPGEKNAAFGGKSQASREASREARREKARKLARRRRQVLRELLATEKTHLRSLQLLHVVFYQPLTMDGQLLTAAETRTLFANHNALLNLHRSIYSLLKRYIKPALKKRDSSLSAGLRPVTSSAAPPSPLQELGAQLVQLFEGRLGSQLEREAAVFCVQQNAANELLRNKSAKSYKFVAFLAEAEAHPALQRKQLKDLLASCFQRVTKYPLLLNELAKTCSEGRVQLQATSHHQNADGSTPTNLSFKASVERSLVAARRILMAVNSRVRDAEAKERLEYLQRKTAVCYEAPPPISQLLAGQWHTNLRLEKEGPLQWRITKQKLVECHILLTQQVLVILSRDSSSLPATSTAALASSSSLIANQDHHGAGDRDALSVSTIGSSHSTASNASDKNSAKQSHEYVLRAHQHPLSKTLHSPLLTVGGQLYTRPVATDKTAFFVLSTVENAVYEFVCSNPQEKRQWIEAIGRVVEVVVNKNSNTTSPTSSSAATSPTAHQPHQDPQTSPSHPSLSSQQHSSSQASPTSPTNSGGVRVEGTIRVVTEREERENQLIDFSQVTVTQMRARPDHQQHQHISNGMTSSASSSSIVLSAAERLRRLESEIGERVEARRRLLVKAAEEGDALFGASDSANTNDGHDEYDLLSLVCRLELSSLTVPATRRPALISRAIHHLQNLQSSEHRPSNAVTTNGSAKARSANSAEEQNSTQSAEN